MSYSQQLRMTECIDSKGVDAIIAKDVKEFSITDCDANHMAYYTCINTWCLMLADYSNSEDIAKILLRHIKYYGMIHTIKECDSYADVLIRQLSYIDDVQHVIELEKYRDDIHKLWIVDLIMPIHERLSLREVLQFLRFPKRLTLHLDIDQGELTNLLNINNGVKLRDRKGYDRHLTPYMVDAAKAYCSPWRPDAFPRSFSNGAAADSRPPRIHKIRAMRNSRITQYDLDGNILCCSYPNQYMDPDMWTVSPILVPKNVEKKRVIAPEHAWRQYHMSNYSTMLDHNMERVSRADNEFPVILLHDQSVSRYAALLSANPNNYRRYATIDLSNASDRVSESLVRTIFPHASDICRYTAKYLQFGKKRVTKYLYSTAGSRMTFPVESIVFASIAYACTQYHKLFTNNLTLLRPIVYGDDIMVDERVAQLTIEVLEDYGFSVNVSKSFSSGYFKESCGVESWLGMDVSSSFFPRHQFSNRKNGKACADDIASLCELQHRVFHCRTASSFLIDFVRTLMPRMTSHYPQTDCSDLWEVDPKPVIRDRRGKEFIPDDPIYMGYWYYSIASKSEVDVDPDLDELFEYFIYMEYLEKGPLYLDDVSKAVGVSTSRKRMTDRFSQKSFYKLTMGD